MKLYNLSASDTAPCIVLKFKSCTIMLDCCLDFSSLQNFLPIGLIENPRLQNLPKWKLLDEHDNLVTDKELKECSGRVFVDSVPEFSIPETDLLDLTTVDVILLSNSASMFALPYITEYTGFKGTIYATEPSLQFGRLLMEELIEYCHHRVLKTETATKWKNRKYKKQLPSSLSHCWEKGLSSWRVCYNSEDLNKSLSKVQIVGYAEKVSVFGALNITASSSGFSLGSCNWKISSDFEKISYLSASSSLTTHPQQLNAKSLHNSDLLIFTGLTQVPNHNPDNMLAEFCSCLAKTVKAGGNVLVPCSPSGLLYDLLECLLSYMEQSNLINIPIYLMSPSAKASLASSQIYSEWLHPNKQNKAYLPEPPFPHDELIHLGRLKVFSSVHDGLSSNFKKPCIVFAGHASLRFGDAVHFVELWSKSASNSFIFVEPNFSYLDALAPFQPITARVYHFPIDTRSNHQAASRLIDSLKPRLLVAPPSYLKAPINAPHRTDLKLVTECPITKLERNSVLNLNIKRTSEKVNLDPELASSLTPSEVKSGVLMAPLSAQVITRDNAHLLKPVYKRVAVGRKRKLHDEVIHRPLLSGKLCLTSFVDDLKQEGFSDVKIEDGSSGKIILLQDTVIQIDDGSTHIVCEGSESLRIKLRDLFLKNLTAI
uniref:Integrator complex subunit 9 n=1 Tax=Phallusia mammillata TaxID=59560 RepID=A0A6F9DEP6_9ASCI|nr:integrator complex subunit 9 [Phallusia mammillata]